MTLTVKFSTPLLANRIALLSNVFHTILILAGIAAIASQIVQVLLLSSNDGKWVINDSHLLTIAIGIGLLRLGKGTAIESLIRYSLFTGRETIKRWIFGFPIAATLGIIFLLKAILGSQNRAYLRMMDEGGFFEYGTFVAYFVAFCLAGAIGKNFIKNRLTSLGIIYLALSAFYLFVSLEEINWGQRFIGLDLPDFFQKYNVQQEINIHDLVWFHYYLRDATIGLSSIGAFSWLVFALRNSGCWLKTWGNFLIPDWFFSSYFLMSLLLSVLVGMDEHIPFFVPKDQEFAELMMSLGFLSWTIVSYCRQALALSARKRVSGVTESAF